MKKAIFLGAVSLAFCGQAHAVLKIKDVLGTAVAHDVPGRTAELCMIPQHFADGKYKKKDVQHETELCAFDAGVNVAACVKTYSTNPAVIFFSTPSGTSVTDLAAKDCELEGAKKEAKYKLSTSCSYTPSLLAYYHVSRMLGDIVNVPVAVVRTMDIDRHKDLAGRALKALGNSDDVIYKTWLGLRSNLEKGLGGQNADLLFVEGGRQSYGALQRNPRGEEFYQDFFNKGVDRIQAFKDKNKIYAALTNPTLAVGREWNQLNVQAMQQLKDLSDMLVIDTVLGQQDRMGNIHYRAKFYYPEKKDGKLKIKNEDDKEAVPEELRARALEVKEMMLKDNDCGVAKENRIKAAKLLDGVAHIDPKTYKHLLHLAQSGDQNKDLFLRGMLLTEADYRTVMGNIKEAADMLKSGCQSGRLKLDLNLNRHFSDSPLEISHDCDGI